MTPARMPYAAMEALRARARADGQRVWGHTSYDDGTAGLILVLAGKEVEIANEATYERLTRPVPEQLGLFGPAASQPLGT